MKNQLMLLGDKLLLRKGSLVETSIDPVKTSWFFAYFRSKIEYVNTSFRTSSGAPHAV